MFISFFLLLLVNSVSMFSMHSTILLSTIFFHLTCNIIARNGNYISHNSHVFGSVILAQNREYEFNLI